MFSDQKGIIRSVSQTS